MILKTIRSCIAELLSYFHDWTSTINIDNSAETYVIYLYF